MGFLQNIDPQKTLILLVEDEAVYALLTRLMLRRHGFEVEVAYSGEAALDFIERTAVPDLVIMDVDLGPGLDGAETAGLILRRWDLPIVFLTFHGSGASADKMRGIPGYGYVLKDSGDFVLLSTIRMALETAAKLRALKERIGVLAQDAEFPDLGTWRMDLESASIELSERSRAILGLDAKTIDLGAFEAMVAQESRAARAAAIRELLEQRRSYDAEYRVLRGDGEIIHVRSSGRVVGDEAVGFLQDLTYPAPPSFLHPCAGSACP